MTPVEKLQWLERLHDSPDLKESAIRVGFYLCRCLNHKSGQLNPSMVTIGRETKTSKSGVKRAIKALVEGGLVVVNDRGTGKGNCTSYGLLKGSTREPIKGSPVNPKNESKGSTREPERGSPVDSKGFTREPNGQIDLLDEPMKEPMKKKGEISEAPPKKNNGKKVSVSGAEKSPWELPDGIDELAWSEFESHRKLIKKPLNDLARTKAANLLLTLSTDNQRECVDYSIRGGYTGLFTDRFKGKGPGFSGVNYEKGVDSNGRF